MEEKSFFAKGTVSNTGKAVYINAETRYIFNHDFPIGCDFPTEIQKVAAKYRKRYNRLLELFAKSERVLFVRMDIPGGDDPTSVEACRLARKRLNERFAPAKFDALLVSYDPTVPFERRRFEKVEEGLFRLTFDYLDRTNPLPLQPDTSLTSVALAEHFSVDDYRTAEEKRSFAKARRRKRLQRLKDKIVRHLDKLLLHLSCWFHGRFNLLDDIRARRNRRKFSQFVILGFNCETAFRFYRRWGFLDSSLFAWANSGDLGLLTKAIARLSELGTGTFTFHAPSRMWRCDRTRLYFHGKMRPRPGAPAPTEDELSADREDLRSRLAHLKEKFVAYATNDKPTLFVYRLGNDARLPGLDEKLTALEKALRDLGTVNGQLLVVCERADLKRMPQAPGRIFRAVNRFNPPDNVTNSKRGDSAGWNRIFTEFAPERILPKAHGFKFEDR